MSIQYNTSNKIFNIKTKNTSYQFMLGKHGFFHDNLGNGGILLQVELKLAADDTVNRSSRLAVAQLLLRLAFELGILDLNADDRRHPLADILPAQILLRFL